MKYGTKLIFLFSAKMEERSVEKMRERVRKTVIKIELPFSTAIYSVCRFGTLDECEFVCVCVVYVCTVYTRVRVSFSFLFSKDTSKICECDFFSSLQIKY